MHGRIREANCAIGFGAVALAVSLCLWSAVGDRRYIPALIVMLALNGVAVTLIVYGASILRRVNRTK